MKLSTFAFIAANAALASASAAHHHNVAGRDNHLQARGDSANAYHLHQWDPKEHIPVKGASQAHHSPSPSPWHPTSVPTTGKTKTEPCTDKTPTTQPTTKTYGPSQWHHSSGPSQWHHGTTTSMPYPTWTTSKPCDTETKTSSSHPSWASASARNRLPADKGLFALYGQAAAAVCGTTQIQGAEITACPMEGGQSGWDCINTSATLESCGGCLSLGQGEDCTLIKGVDKVGCVHGKCVVGSCMEGYTLDSDKMLCVAN